MSEEKEMISVVVPEQYVTERAGKYGVFYQAKMPKGFKFNGEDIGGFSFTCSNATMKDGKCTLDFYKSEGRFKDVVLNRSIKNDNEEWENNKDFITPSQLSDLCKENFRNVSLLVNKAFINTFSFTSEKTGEEITKASITIPNGVVYDGKDLGGYQFVVSPKALSDIDGHDNLQKVSFYSFYDIPVSKNLGEKNEKGEWIPKLDEQGNQLKDSLKVNINDLADGYKAQFEKFKEQNQDKEVDNTDKDFEPVSDEIPFDEPQVEQGMSR